MPGAKDSRGLFGKFRDALGLTLHKNDESNPAPPPAAPPPPTPPRELIERIGHSSVHPVLTGPALLAALPRWPDIEARIRRWSQVDPATFSATYLAALHAYAERVQLLPASEAHHHAYPLGQLEHTLEAVEHALQRRASKLLPLGAEPEREARERLVWTFAVFVAALCHDVGKPMARFGLEARIKGAWVSYTPMGRTLPELGAVEYQWRWVQRAYEFHNQISPLMFAMIVPPAGRAWLGTCPQALGQVAAYLYGDRYNCGVIGELAQAGDQASAASNLGLRTPVGLGEKMPLHKLAELALRNMARDWNINGHKPNGEATGTSDAWIRGDYVFCRSNVMNELHDVLQREGATGLPGEPVVLMTKLCDVGLAMNHKTSNGQPRAVWHVRIVAANRKVVSEKFSVLVFPVDALFALGSRPEQWEGTLDVVEPALPPTHVLSLHTRPPQPVGADPSQVAQPPAPPVTTSNPSVAPPDAPMLATSMGASPVAIGSPAAPAAPAESPPAPPGTKGPAVSAASRPTAAAAAPAVPAPAGSATSLTTVSGAAALIASLGGLPAAAPEAPEPAMAPPAPRPAPIAAAPSLGAPPGAEASTPEIAPANPTRAAQEDRCFSDAGDFLPAAHRGVPEVLRAWVRWIRSSMGTPMDDFTILTNKRHALVHGLPDLPGCWGVVSPLAFHEFLARSGYVWSTGEYLDSNGMDHEGARPTLEQLQALFRTSEWSIHSGTEKGRNVLAYQIGTREDAPTLTLVALTPEASAELTPEGMSWQANPVLIRKPRTSGNEKAKAKEASASAPPLPIAPDKSKPGPQKSKAKRPKDGIGSTPSLRGSDMASILGLGSKKP